MNSPTNMHHVIENEDQIIFEPANTLNTKQIEFNYLSKIAESNGIPIYLLITEGFKNMNHNSQLKNITNIKTNYLLKLYHDLENSFCHKTSKSILPVEAI